MYHNIHFAPSQLELTFSTKGATIMPDPIEIPYEDELVHTPENHYMCGNPTCGCSEDPILIAEIAAEVEAGTLTPEKATDIVTNGGNAHA